MKILKRIEENRTNKIYLYYRNDKDVLCEDSTLNCIEYVFQHDGVEYKRFDRYGTIMIQTYNFYGDWLNVEPKNHDILEELFQKELLRIYRIKKLERLVDGTE